MNFDENMSNERGLYMNIREAIETLSCLELDLSAEEHEKGYDFYRNRLMEALNFALELLRKEESYVPIDILYLCDFTACSKAKTCEVCLCYHTNNINHAINKDDLDGRLFEYVDRGDRIAFFEKE